MRTNKNAINDMEEKGRNVRFYFVFVMVIFALNFTSLVHAENYSGTIKLFKKSKAVQPFFKTAYGYAVFPVIGKGGFFVGGAYGNGRVYQDGKITGIASLIKISVGWQAGGQAFSEIIFFQDKRAYNEFTSGEFAFDVQASAVAITTGAQMQAGTEGASIGASVGPRTGVQAKTRYIKGMAVFVHTKGGFMYEAAIGGQKFSFTPVRVK